MPESVSSIKESASPTQTALYILRVPFLRNILAACMAVAILLPLYNVVYLSPSYRHVISSFSEDNARRLAAHLMLVLKITNSPISSETLTAEDQDVVKQLRINFDLYALKLLDSRGAIVFSSKAAEIGERNTDPDILQKVAKGHPYSQIVTDETGIRKDSHGARDVVDVYVPLMNRQHFLGAFKICYDITGAYGRLNTLLRHSNITIGLISLALMVFMTVVLFKTGVAMVSHSHMDQALHQAHDSMEQKVNERTKDLIDANKDLQMEIMERRIAETNLRESEKRFRTLVNTIPHGIQEIDTDGTITFANPAHAKIYDCESRQLIGTSILDLAAGESERQQLEAHLAHLAEHQPQPHPWFGTDSTNDGRIINTQVDWNYKRDVQGRVLGLITVISDITHRKRAEKALLDNLNFMNTLIDTIPNPVFYKDNKGLYLGCNVAYVQTLGVDKEKILGRRLVDLESTVASEIAQHYHRQDLLLIQKPGVQSHEERVNCADGRKRDFVLYKATFNDIDDKVAGMVGIMLDITEHKKAEKAVKESKNLFDAFMQHLPGLAYMKDPQGRYIYVNDTFAQLTDTKIGEPIGRRANEVWDSDTGKRIDTNDEEVFSNQVAANHMENVRLPDGRERHLLTARFPIFQDNALFALGGISIDITERTIAQNQRRQLEIQLQQTQKMEALGTLAGGIAHDFNNILAAIIGYTEIAAADIGKASPAHEYLGRVLESGERARSLVKQILAFSRQGDMEPKPVQVKLIIKEVLKLLRASLPATIDIIQEIHSDGAVMVDPTQLHQVMMNLGTNAGYAMGQTGGKLTVRLEEVDITRDAITRSPVDIEPGPYLRLSVIDTGYGIGPEHLAKIFDPFFTTKPKGEGTGMGLAVVHGIVTGLGGAITVDATPNQGTRFDVLMPALPRETKTQLAEKKVLPVGKERILFVDDEPFQTDMIKHLLGLLGYRVETYNSGTEAWSAFEQDTQGFDLVITDMIMPEMTGDQLAQKMLDQRPDQPILVVTGYSEGFTEAKAKAMGLRGVILKPLAIEELAKTVRQVLDER